jgi:hypothetical protein
MTADICYATKPHIRDLETHMVDADGAVQALVALAECPEDIKNNANAILWALGQLEDHQKALRTMWCNIAGFKEDSPARPEKHGCIS